MDCLNGSSSSQLQEIASNRLAENQLPGFTGDEWAAQVLRPALPLINDGYQRLVALVRVSSRRSPRIQVDAQAYARDWFGSIYGRLLTMMVRTVVLELHVARVECGLEGETPEARFTSFCSQLAQPASVEQFFTEYPLLEQQIEQLIDQTIDAAWECLERLIEDSSQVISLLHADFAAPVYRVVHVDADRSDRHRGGRRVVILEFDNGDKVVYKPRSMAIDVQFGHLTAWLNARGSHPALRLPQVIDRGDYGWCEFVRHEPCVTQAEVERFYARLGAYVALLYVVQGTDFHSENLLAVGEHPMLIDLESLLVPQQDAFSGTDGADQAAGQAFANSVLRAGILPHGIWAYGDSEGIDISGIGTVAGKQTPFRVPYFRDAGTDQMRLDRVYRPMIASQNQPTWLGARVDPLDYRASLHEGFRSAYTTLRQYREELLDPAGPLTQCADCEVRVLLRLTQTYASLYDESFHPDLLRDADDRAAYFERLNYEVARNPSLANVVASEVRDLASGNVPRFTTTPGSRDVWTSDREPVIDFYPESGLEAAYACLRRLGDEDFTRQQWLIDAALSTTVQQLDPMPLVQVSTAPVVAEETIDQSHVQSLVAQIVHRLDALAIRSQREANWLGVVHVGDRKSGIRPLQDDLYDGLAGVTLFLAYAAEKLDDRRARSLAESSLRTLSRCRVASGERSGSIGAWDGWGGYLMTLVHLSHLWDRPDLMHEALQIAPTLRPLIESSTADGVLGGTAGLLLSLLALHQVAHDDSILDIATCCGRRLQQRAQRQSVGIGWEPREGEAPLAGMAHGAAGIALALHQLAAQTHDRAMADLANQAIAYERHLFSDAVGNWRDLRPRRAEQGTSNQDNFICAWCHGAPGIGLARLALPITAHDEFVGAEIETALNSTEFGPWGENHSLCHGDLGNLELFLSARQHRDTASLRETTDRLSRRIVEDIGTHGWRTGVALRIDHPGMMTGLAGIGYGLLRLADPQHVPAILSLQRP